MPAPGRVRRVGEQLERALAHRPELVHDDLGETLLEVAVAATGVLVLDRGIWRPVRAA
jgi:hypothetical protein